MPDADLLRALDNPMWSCLTTRHAHLALGGALARRYPEDISPIAGMPDVGTANVAALQSLVDVGGTMVNGGLHVPRLPSNWETMHASRMTQMIRTDRALLPEAAADVESLGAQDVADMLALVEATEPGPFRPRTIELGRFVGIRENGRLVAMAGERMWIADCREVSGVCTHPGVQGRGYATALMARVINRMLRAGETPFLHVESSNTRAIGVYRTLGFVERAEFPLLYARRIA